ncbi:B12-binding domain-containing radical SAM protein [bacterium]|nr:B12-binding domain-containing radical SAM protein [bacterium]
MTRIALVSLSESSNLHPPLGLLSIGSYLRRELPLVEVTLVDANVEDPLERLLSEDFDLIGFSAMTVRYGRAIDMAGEIRRKKPTPLIVGGVHVSTLPESLDPAFDAAVIGEGEVTMRELVQLLETGGGLSSEGLRRIPGLVFFEDGRPVSTGRRELMDLADLPLTDWSLLDPRYFRPRRFDEVGRFAVGGSLMTSRGCPYKCAFCSTTHFWGHRVRNRPIGDVIEDLRDLVEVYGITHVMFWDDLFTVQKERLRDFAQALEEAGLSGRLTFSCDSRANVFDEEVCFLLRRIGVEGVFFGFESGSDRVLEYLKGPGVRVAHNRRAVDLGVRHGFKVQGNMIFASPGETLKDMRASLEFMEYAARKGAYRIQWDRLVPFPATPVWDAAHESGQVRERMDWERLAFADRKQRPMLLDPSIDSEAYRSLLSSWRFRRLRLLFRWRILRAYLRHSPVRLFGYAAGTLWHKVIERAGGTKRARAGKTSVAGKGKVISF